MRPLSTYLAVLTSHHFLPHVTTFYVNLPLISITVGLLDGPYIKFASLVMQ